MRVRERARECASRGVHFVRIVRSAVPRIECGSAPADLAFGLRRAVHA